MTLDQAYLLVGHDDSEYIYVYDLNTLKAASPILLPGGHFARSIAVSNAAILALVRNEGGDPAGLIDSINLAGRTATALPSLGVYENKLPTSTGVLTASPSGSNILMATPDGNVALYSAASNSFVVSRHDLTSLSGSFAASDYGLYVAGNSVLNASLVPSGTLSSTGLSSSGFSFLNQGGYMAAAASASTAGTLLQVSSLQSGAAGPTSVLMTEAPLLPVDISSANSIANTYGTYGSGGNNLHAPTSFSRSVAVLPNAGTIVALSTSGLTLLGTSYPVSPVPQINAVTSAADGVCGCRAWRPHQYLWTEYEWSEFRRQPGTVDDGSGEFVHRRQWLADSAALRFCGTDQRAVAVQCQRQRDADNSYSGWTE
jgi:hypothetical protein